MCAQHDVQRPFAEPGNNGLLLFLGVEAGECFHRDAVPVQTVAERVEMLDGKYCRGDKHADLPARKHAFEGGTDGDFGLAESHIPADETIHGG